MKIPTPVILASIALNAVLLSVIALGFRSAQRGDSVSAGPRHPIAVAPAPRVVTAATWSELQADDFAAERDRLRAEEFPPSLVRAILAAQIHDTFATRRKAIEDSTADVPFWKNVMQPPETRAALRDLAKEERKTIADLLGPDTESGTVASLRRQLPNASQDKLEQLAAISDRYQEQLGDIYSTTGGNQSAADREKIRAIEKAMHEEFATVLTPDELTDYDLRNSRTANNLRWRLSAFDATEQEYRAIYQLQAAFDDQYGSNGPLAPDERRARNEAQKQLDQQIATALGPDRYADYQRANDYSYQLTTRLVDRLGLGTDVANQVYAVQKDVQARLTSIRNDALSPQERNTQLEALATEAQTKISTMLGATGYEAYKRYGGQWLVSIAPRPANSSGPRPAITAP